MIDFTFSKHGLIKGDRVFNKMKEFIPDTNIEDLKIHYTATATDLLNKNEVVFTKGSIYEAIRASIAIPTVFTPVKMENMLFVDGGVTNNIPINHAKRTENDLLVVAYVNADTPIYKPEAFKKDKKKKSIYLEKVNDFKTHFNKIYSKDNNKKLGYCDILNKTVEMMMYKLAMLSIEKFPPDILINISRNTCGTFDFYKAEELVEIGRDMANESIKIFNNSIAE